MSRLAEIDRELAQLNLKRVELINERQSIIQENTLMTLYEVTNGYLGQSYIRVYVWCEDETTAIDMARESFKSDDGYDETYYNKLRCVKLFSGDSKPFSTLPSGDGWEVKS